MPVDEPTTVEEEEAGAVLRAAREAAGLTVAEVARRLKLTVRLVEAIEANDRRRFPPAVYLRGFVRNYARLLGLDAEPLLAAYGQAQPTALQSVEGPRSGGGSLPGFLGWLSAGEFPPLAVATAAVCLMAGVLLVVVVWLWVAESGPDPAGAQVATPAAEAASAGDGRPDMVETGAVPGVVEAVDPAAAATVPAESAAGQVGVEAPLDVPGPEADGAAASEAGSSGELADAGGGTTPEPVTTDEPVAGHGAAGVVSPPDDGAQSPGAGGALPVVHRLTPIGDEELQFEFTEDCWVEVFDTEGGILFQDLMRRHQSVSLVGAGPFQIRLGYAPGVTLAYNGEPVPLAPHTRNNVALLVVGQ